MAINSTQKGTLDTPTEAREAVNVLKSARNILGVSGSGITCFPVDDEGMVRCDVCFALFLENDPTLTGKDPFFICHTNTSSAAGNSLVMGLNIPASKKEKYAQGHNQELYRFQKNYPGSHKLFIESQSRR